jgi:hypothetical protein
LIGFIKFGRFIVRRPKCYHPIAPSRISPRVNDARSIASAAACVDVSSTIENFEEREREREREGKRERERERGRASVRANLIIHSAIVSLSSSSLSLSLSLSHSLFLSLSPSAVPSSTIENTPNVEQTASATRGNGRRNFQGDSLVFTAARRHRMIDVS